MAMKVGGDDRNLRDQAQWPCRAGHPCELSSLRGIKATESRNRRADGMHRRRVLGQRLDDIDHSGRQFASRGQAFLQFVKFLAIGQMAVMQQMNDFLERDFAGQVRRYRSRNKSICRRRLGHRSVGCWRRRCLQDLWRSGGSGTGHELYNVLFLK